MSITLHPEKGVNPRLTVCVNCGESTGVVLMGRHDKVWQCQGCGLNHIGGKPENNKCPCGSSNLVNKGEVPEGARIPSDLCDSCMEQEKKCMEEVEKGGVYWRCTDCGSTGAIKAGTPVAKEIREAQNIPAPEPIGVEVSKDDCPMCGPSSDS
jgi:ribosomal protein S27AE